MTDEVAAHTKNDFISGWDSYSTVDGVVYGIPGRSNIKSLVWYSPKMFADGGYEIPTTLDELKALSDKIVADGGTPWCVGAESGVATGWVLTDWMEDFMLRVNGPEVYDQWVNHEIPFNDPKVAAVVEAVGEYVKNPDYLGGEDKVKAIATTKFQDGGLPILDGNCYMHRQASFYASLWPEGTVVGADGDVNIFYLPSPAGGPKYMLGAGDIYAAGSDKPETMAVLAYTGSADYQIEIVNKRQELSPNKSIDINSIEDPFTKQLSELQASADVFRFDASDLMPGAVGAGSFWTEVTNWVIGQEDTQAFVDNVEKSWPAS
ncbi:MAG: ABC transporter substrate-binding protein [Ilumatobacteraceae bacterium]